jgi:integrase
LILGEFEIDKNRPKCPAFKEYAQIWLALTYNWKDGTKKEYEIKLRHCIYPVLGKARIDEIKRSFRKDRLTDTKAGQARKVDLTPLLRHSYATIRLLRGHNIGDVSYQLGHSSIQTTYDIYTHWIPGEFKAEVDSLDKMQKSAHHPHVKDSEV